MLLDFSLDRRITFENTQGLQQFTLRNVKELLLKAIMVDLQTGIPCLQRESQEHLQDIGIIPGDNFNVGSYRKLGHFEGQIIFLHTANSQAFWFNNHNTLSVKLSQVS